MALATPASRSETPIPPALRPKALAVPPRALTAFRAAP